MDDLVVSWLVEMCWVGLFARAAWTDWQNQEVELIVIFAMLILTAVLPVFKPWAEIQVLQINAGFSVLMFVGLELYRSLSMTWRNVEPLGAADPILISALIIFTPLSSLSMVIGGSALIGIVYWLLRSQTLAQRIPFVSCLFAGFCIAHWIPFLFFN